MTTKEAECLIMVFETKCAGAIAMRKVDIVKYLRRPAGTVDPVDGSNKVNVGVLLQLLRSGARLTGVISTHARDQFNHAHRQDGLSFNNKAPVQNFADLLDQLRQSRGDVAIEHTKTRVYGA